MKDLAQESVRVLREAGWNEGRSVEHFVDGWARLLDTPGGFSIFPAARRALLAFGGLHVKQTGAGAECARRSFNLDPTTASGEEESFRDAAAEVGSMLYPLGEDDTGMAFLAIDDQGRVYWLGPFVSRMGDDINEGLNSLILGYRGKRIGG